MLPTTNNPSNLGIRRAKKRVNTLLLDWRQCIPSSTVSVLAFLLFISVTAILSFSLWQAKQTHLVEKTILQIEGEQLRNLLREQAKERQDMEQLLVDSNKLVQEQEGTLATLRNEIALRDDHMSNLRNEASRLKQSLEDSRRAAVTPHPPPPLTPVHVQPPPVQPPPVVAVPPPPPPPVVPRQVVEEPPKPVVNQVAGGVILPTHDDADPIAATRRRAVKDAMTHAWNSYKRLAWGRDELKPISKSYSDWLGMGVTIIDALDTLYIMNMRDEFKEGRDWVDRNLNFANIHREVSLFETTIRELGGLLSAYEFSRDKMFLDRAEDLGQRLLKGFDADSGLPYASIHLTTGKGRSPGWTGGASILSEMGTLQLEFLYLAYHTNNPQYAIMPLDVFKHLKSIEPANGLYPLYVHPKTGRFQGNEISFGALGDSFYEYMLKLWLFTNKQASGYRGMYERSMRGAINHLIRTSKNGLRYLDQMNNAGGLEDRMEHLACFAGGMFALGAETDATEYPSEHLQVGADLTETCHESYARTATGIGPEFFEFKFGGEVTVPSRAKHYLLRPETVESYFVLWRVTKDPKYREWGWQAFQAIEKHCRTPDGYSGIQDVNSVPVVHDDLQQSFFLAETLKYLYLLFSPDDLIPLDQYVFNTEAHPLGIIREPLSTWPQELRFHLLEKD